ncbi:MAG: aspartyl protease family protein [bacterium]
MGLVETTGLIGRNREELTEVAFLVDTGSFYSAISPATREKLGLPRGISTQVQLADGRIVGAELTVAYLRLNGRECAIPVEVMEVPVPLIGVSALEALGMKVNPVSGELEVVWPFQAPPTMKRFP